MFEIILRFTMYLNERKVAMITFYSYAISLFVSRQHVPIKLKCLLGHCTLSIDDGQWMNIS